jgi:hypothetical protein
LFFARKVKTMNSHTHIDDATAADRRADKWAFLKAWARGAADGAIKPERPTPRRKLTAAARADTPAA